VLIPCDPFPPDCRPARAHTARARARPFPVSESRQAPGIASPRLAGHSTIRRMLPLSLRSPSLTLGLKRVRLDAISRMRGRQGVTRALAPGTVSRRKYSG
jgi:hypothetical protein